MNIAIIAPPFIPVPPPRYGGTELFVATLAETLTRRGHRVIVYASGDSHGAFEVRSLFPRGQWPPPVGLEGHLRSMSHYAWAVRDAAACDVIHVNDVAGVFFAPYVDEPVVLTLHHPHEPALSAVYADHPDVTYVAISDAQRLHEPMSRLTTIHHGIDVRDFRACEEKEDYVAFLGRIAPCKGVEVAIDVARRAGVPLKIAGQVQSFFQEYWEAAIRPQIDGRLIDYVGEADLAMKNDLLGPARALLFPLQWEEPFGLVMIEAMACGTPVIAFDRGSVREVVRHGSTGWICRDVEEMVDVVRERRAFAAGACRRHVEDHFSAERMAADYERTYRAARDPITRRHDRVAEGPTAHVRSARAAPRSPITG
jgi:glycosyltransferase involved in cell wall biosynthesis